MRDVAGRAGWPPGRYSGMADERRARVWGLVAASAGGDGGPGPLEDGWSADHAQVYQATGMCPRSVAWNWKRRWRCCGPARSRGTRRWTRSPRRWQAAGCGLMTMRPASQLAEDGPGASCDNARRSYG